MTATDRELTVGDVRLRYRDEGAGSALVLIHGWTLDLEMWEPQARELCGSMRVIRYDRRGFGLSSGRPAPSEDVGDLLALCDHLGLRSVVLVGMSQGARVAAHAAAGHPGLISCVVFDGAPPGTVFENAMFESDIPIDRYRELTRVGGARAFREAWRHHPVTQLQTRDASCQELLQRILERYRAEDLTDPDPRGSLPPQEASAIRAPALVISGALETDSRLAAADALARALPSSRRAIIPAAGHLANLDNPGVYNSLLRRFSGTLSRRKS